MDEKTGYELETAYRLYSDEMYELAYMLTGKECVAWDVVNDTFVETIRHYRWWMSLTDTARKNYLIKTCRRIAQNNTLDNYGTSGCDYNDLAINDKVWSDVLVLRETVSGYMEHLTEGEKTAVRMKYFEGSTADEIGEYCGITKENALQRLHRARQKLKKAMENDNMF